jgi:hypothetical protein
MKSERRSFERRNTMSRLSINVYHNGKLWAGYDYDNQAWVENGVYLRCSHKDACGCFGKRMEGLTVEQAQHVLDEEAKQETLDVLKLAIEDGKARNV